jgi:hypothetical protein
MKHITLLAASLLAVSATAQIADESFENSGAGSGEWTQSSTNFTTPLCNPSCGVIGANTGVWYAWFGGVGPGGTLPEVGNLDQDVAIPAGSTVNLVFQVAMFGAGGVASDYVELNIDGAQQWEATVADSDMYVGAYAEQSVSLALWAGTTENIEFHGEQTDTSSISNFFIDDVVIEVNGIPVLGLFENESLPGMQVVPNPADAMLTMTFNALEGMGVVTITDLNGRTVSSQQLSQINQRTFTYDSSVLPNGVYMVSLENAGKVYTQRVVVAH